MSFIQDLINKRDKEIGKLNQEIARISTNCFQQMLFEAEKLIGKKIRIKPRIREVMYEVTVKSIKIPSSEDFKPYKPFCLFWILADGENDKDFGYAIFEETQIEVIE